MSSFQFEKLVSSLGQVEKLEKALRLFQEVLDSWLECQKNWMYLESIFSAPDIQRQLPNEAKAFASVDKQFKVRARAHTGSTVF